MRRLLLGIATAAVGAAAMLVGLDAAHHYGMERVHIAAEAAASLNVDTGDPPPPAGAREAAAARPACEAMAQTSGLSMRELSYAGGLGSGIPVTRVDRDALDESFGYLDGLRMTLFGLSSRDMERVRASLRPEPEAMRMRARLEGLRRTLRACGAQG